MSVMLEMINRELCDRIRDPFKRCQCLWRHGIIDPMCTDQRFWHRSIDPEKALEEYCSCLSLSYAARILGISPSRLKKIIKEHYGWPPKCEER